MTTANSSPDGSIEPFSLALSRKAGAPLAEQISNGIGAAILEGRLAAGARLPSWRDLAAQLGVARGTVKAAYERLADDRLIVASGPRGTHVSNIPPLRRPTDDDIAGASLAGFFTGFSQSPKLFQMGVPAQDAFPFKTWSRIMARGARTVAALPASYPDPRGEAELRRQIASYLALARSLQCRPRQVFITSGYAGAIGFIVQALELKGGTAWVEEPGFPVTRKALALAGVDAAAVEVDGEGLVVARGIAAARRAALAIVTPGQQAPLGMALSARRREELLAWAHRAGAWIVEDDYLSELQLAGRAAPALASPGPPGRVIHFGSFSKTISPALRLGFIVVPEELVRHFGDVAACLAPAANATAQHAVAEFLREGHYLRHLRRMKTLYAARRDRLMRLLRDVAPHEAMAGLAVLVHLPDGADDAGLVRQAASFDMMPRALSPWYAAPEGRSGLLLGVTNAAGPRLDEACARLCALIRKSA
ncbi:MAG: PLP-dependent aminotransferase family protein [Parvibaculaceae bacterium]